MQWKNPYLISPLTALILFETEKEEAITVTVKGRKQTAIFHFTTKKERSHTIPVYGLYADADNTVILSDESGAESSVIIRTKPLPELVKRPAYVKENGPHMAEQLMLLSPTSDALIAGDYRGDCRWYCSLNIVFCHSQTCKRQYSDRDGASGRSAIQYKRPL